MRTRPMLTQEQIELAEFVTVQIRELEAYCNAQGVALFPETDTEYGRLRWARVKGRARLLLDDKPLDEHKWPMRAAVFALPLFDGYRDEAAP